MKIEFSDHAKDRIKERKISISIVIKTIKNPEQIENSFKNRKLFRRNFRGKTLEIVVIKEKELYTVVTAYYLEED
jgi:hypothetical protein